MLRDAIRHRIRSKQRLVGEDGKTQGAGQSLMQTISLTVTHLDS